jgi:hypothetical protein
MSQSHVENDSELAVSSHQRAGLLVPSASVDFVI